MKPVIGVTSDYNGGDRPEFGGSEETCYIRSRYLHAVEETAEHVLDRAAAPLRRAEEALEQGKAQIGANLRAVEKTIRP